MIVSGAAPPMVDTLRRVWRCMFRPVFCRFCHARSRVPIAFGPFHYCASCERAAPDAPETIDDQRRSTGCRYRTIYGGPRGRASHKHIPNYCALRWRARAVVSSIRPRSNSKEVPLEGHRYIEGIVFVIFAIFCEKDSSSPPEKGAAPRKALREENTKKISEQKIAKITKS